MGVEWKDTLGELNGKYGFDLIVASGATQTPSTGHVWTAFNLVGTGCRIKASPTTGNYLSADGGAGGNPIKWKSSGLEQGIIRGRFNAVAMKTLATPGTGAPVLLAYLSKD